MHLLLKAGISFLMCHVSLNINLLALQPYITLHDLTQKGLVNLLTNLQLLLYVYELIHFDCLYNH